MRRHARLFFGWIDMNSHGIAKSGVSSLAPICMHRAYRSGPSPPRQRDRFVVVENNKLKTRAGSVD